MTGGQGPIHRPYPSAGHWVRQAACRGADPTIFYAPGRRNTTAIAICESCPVAAECFDYAIACEDLDPLGGHGIWAGLSGQQRNHIRAQLKESA